MVRTLSNAFETGRIAHRVEIGGFVVQLGHGVGVADLDFEEPASAFRIGVDQRRIGDDGLVHFNDFTIDRGLHFGRRLD